jgi:hypothetical protein
MAWIRIHNRANYPVNVQLSNAGFIYFYENSVKTYTEFFVAGIGWDFDAVFDCDRTKIDPAKGNKSLGVNIGFAVLGVLGAAAGVALTIVTLGAAAPAGAALTVGGVTLSATALGAIGTAIGAAGVVTAAGGIGLAIAQGVTTPARVTGLYGANDYEIYIDGHFKEVDQIKAKNQIQIVVEDKPLVVSWKNDTSGTRGVAAGYTIPD